jgi:N-acetylmuramoyl-L-alanine amidase
MVAERSRVRRHGRVDRIGRARLGRCALAGLAFAAAFGCAPKRLPSPPAPAPTVTRPRAGYEARVDSLDRVEATALAGRRIVLDPGHGGSFRGSLGVGGLTEAAVNLDVARELASLLERHGAVVTLTRTSDRDFLSPADSALRVDLAERTRLANDSRPELFVSIHHNADASGAHDRNEIQTYYKLGDEGPSLDAARSLHRYLKRNLAIDGQRILPGNYFVLRNSEAPAVLTEASFITNPDVEAKLALPEKRRLEAEALFLGIADFFSRSRPEIVSLEARMNEIAPAETVFAEVAAPVLSARVAGEFDDWSLTLDGEPVAGTRAGGRLIWRPATLEQGRHVAALNVRMSGEGAALERRIAFTIRRRPARMTIAQWPPSTGARSNVAVRIEVSDALGLPFRDTVSVRLRGGCTHERGPRWVKPCDTLLVARDGVAWAYLRTQTRLGDNLLEASLRLPPVRRGAAPRTLTARGAIHNLAPGGTPRWQGFVREMPSGDPLRGIRGTEEPHPRNAWLNRDGYGWVDRDSSGTLTFPSLPGYRAWPPEEGNATGFVAIAGGALHGRRIALDPDGGGADTSGMGPGGTRAAMVNLDVARALRGLLEAAGAEVLIVRERDEALPDVERVRRSEAFGAERYLRIARRAEPPRLGFYFSSPGGRAWAERAAATLASLALPTPPLAEDAQYPLQQTSCPALYAALRRIDDPRDEEALHAPGALRAEAYAYFVTLAREWAPTASWPIDSLAVRDDDGRAVPGSFVTLGGALVLETDALGWVRWARTESGPLEARCAAVDARRVLLDSDRGIVLTGPRGR